jgi:hypothetical protein
MKLATEPCEGFVNEGSEVERSESSGGRASEASESAGEACGAVRSRYPGGLKGREPVAASEASSVA